MKYTGTVQKGGGYGRKLGFPTANIPLEDDFSGIYAATVRCNGAEYRAAVYADMQRHLLEAHILDFEGDLYGTEIEIELLAKVRDDREFKDDADAMEQIAKDVVSVRSFSV